MSWESVSFWIEHHPGLASWVQAVGSIASIWGAFAISNKQQKIQIKLAKKAANEKAESLYAVIENAVKTTTTFGELLQTKPSEMVFKDLWQLVYKQHLESSVYSLGKLPAHELGGYEAVRAYSGVMGALTDVVRKVNTYFSSNVFQPSEYFNMCEETLKQVRFVESNWWSFQQAARRNS
ncbi:hypothetical protein C9422_18525 [Pseudomonas sp. B1(2018)]|uniref:hypothetical protein n=1 Tax=Pseudomonas sp. B1(2018) TaxID=2233856 RepID=UPI000D5D2DFD|nr:hypothetical protein [Pseudomonas sp. B1(2018)]PVZ56519.1 hypothetical protein C9422_18525 [Pseudomonas sp. B1(2018)]